MRLIKGLLVFVVVAALLLCGAGFFLPSRAHVERSIVIEVPQANAFAFLNSFRRFEEWSPWKDYDPAMTITRSGPDSGVGAHYAWSGNAQVGTGSQDITASEPNRRIEVALDFGEHGDGTAAYLIEPAGAGTKVTWSFDTDFGNNLIGRYMGLVMDRMMGPDYDKGLARLKALLEAGPKVDLGAVPMAVITTQAQPIAYVQASARTDEAAGVMGAAYATVASFISANGLTEVPPPIAITRKYDAGTRFWEFDAAIPVDRDDVATTPESPVKLAQTYAGTAIRAEHTGPYSTLETTYAAIQAYKALLGYADNGNSWEQYLSDPGMTPQAELKTAVYWPVK